MKTLPREKAQMFEDFGLQPSLCTEINEFGPEGDRHLYVASYFMVGYLSHTAFSFPPRPLQ
ncbi:hypothetical protein [Bacillus halotolerans]|uniref:hypothetical protein n=1 Tax=Bacillus halotolerans TaxID=260554 RepID=UPI002281C530|nr:hypothetical protein [Bacillus halotolerans]MCY8471847.1 hypothetical protein [Bacillus halotolerans]